MKNEQEKLLTVGELAKKGNVTVRTLQYYDSNGLLVPNKYSEGGRRMYSRRDIIRLQQILFLKSLGFSLEEIRDRLLPAESASELEHIFTEQRKILAAQLSRLEEVADMMDKVIAEVNSGSDISFDTLFAIIGATRVGNPYSFIVRDFSKEQLENFFTNYENEDAAVELTKTSTALFDELIELYKKNENPEGPEGQKLAAKWWNLVIKLTKGDPKLIQNIFTAGQNTNNWPEEAKDLKEATQSFLEKAMGEYFKKNKINIGFMEVK